MHFDDFSFGSLRVDGNTYDHDLLIDRGEIRKRKKKPSMKFRDDFVHTPLSVEEHPFGNAAGSWSAPGHMADYRL